MSIYLTKEERPKILKDVDEVSYKEACKILQNLRIAYPNNPDWDLLMLALTKVVEDLDDARHEVIERAEKGEL